MKVAISFLAAILFACAAHAGNLTPLKWEVGYSKTADSKPAKFVEATVPGAVQLDIMKAEKYPPYWVGVNMTKNYWMEDCHYTYRTQFKRPDLKAGERLFFVSKGIDYRFDISLNGKKMFSQEGMFTYVNLDLTENLDTDNTLEIHIYPVPKIEGFVAPNFDSYRGHARHTAKPAVSYGWDWHPRAIPLGIWDETGLEVRPDSYASDAFLKYTLNDDFTKAELELLLEGVNLDGCEYFWTLTDASGKSVLSSGGKISGAKDGKYTVSEPALENPNLWWTHDHGTPYLYTWTFALSDASGNTLQKVSRKVGFRRIRLVMNEGAWKEPAEFPKTRSTAPAQFELNGRRIFAKGSNWVNPEIYFGTITAERYETLVKYLVEMNGNIFRVWGGAIVNKEPFFDYCDKYGILVWQEFPLACNNYWDDPHYLSVLKQEATSIVKRVRKHPSIALWCGGNELFNSWSGMTEQSLALRTLNGVCLEFDPHTPFNYTSPLYGMAHGGYFFQWLYGDKTAMSLFKDAHNTAYTEFGVQGISPIEALREVIPADELWPVRDTPSWRAHHAFGVFNFGWLGQSEVESFCGKATSLDDLVEKSQFLQAQGYKAIFEEARRQKPHCAMAINWDYNDAWLAAAGNTLIAYPDIRKPDFYAVKASLRPFLASARFEKINWSPSEKFVAELALLNDKFAEVSAGKVSAYLVVDGVKTKLLEWDAPVAAPNTNVEGPTIVSTLPAEIKSDRFKFVLECSANPEFNSEYIFTVAR